MTERNKTLGLVGAAVVLAVLTLATTPRHRTPDAFFDEGEEFFPEFTDPNAARTLEVIEYDAQTGTAVPFKVTFSDGRWTIPSHHGYDADGKDRLAQTAAGLIDITKDDFRTDNPADYAACGVIDPLDMANPGVFGRGKRVTIKGENDVILADIVVGKSLEGREGFYLVRVPDQKRVYATRMDLDLSTRFKDWIEPDLMLIEKDEIDEVVLKDYSVDERTGRLDERDIVVLSRDGDAWIGNVGAGEEVDTYKLNNLVGAVDEVTIEGVRPKPEGLSATLSRGGQVSITQGDMLSLQEKGFYFTSDGRLVSNEGELQVHTSDGVTYTLRFGEVVFGTGLAVSAGTDTDDEAETSRENRYLMITTSFDPVQFPEPEKPASLEFQSKPDSLWSQEDYRARDMQATWQRWNEKINSASARSEELNDRFAKWYYVISSDSFDKLHLSREDIVKQSN